MDETTILIVDDEPRVLDALEAILAAEFRVLRANHGEEGLARLAAEPDVAVIVTDHRMPGMTGVELLRRSQEHAPDSVRIVLTAYTDVDSLMEAINTGRIYHFIPKPWDPNGLLVVVRRAVERWHLARENGRLRDELELAYNTLRREAAAGREKPPSFDALVGAASGLRGAVELAGKVLDGDTTALLLGETGTGKELFARLIHGNGPRRAKPFVAQSCGALPDSLLECELFGHARGAFTGATGERKGLFEEAHGGTIFLDEIGETSPAMQPALLRVLQEGEVRRVGGNKTRQVDVRVIAATNVDLEAEVAAGRFRQDLYYRLNVFPIRLPPLRERVEDIPALAEHFLRQACRARPARGAIGGRRGPAPPARLSMAGQRARAGERAGARGGARRRRTGAATGAPLGADRGGSRAGAGGADAQRRGGSSQAPHDRGRAPRLRLQDPGRGAARPHPPEPPADAPPPPVDRGQARLSPLRGGWWW